MRATWKPFTLSLQRIVAYSKLNTFVPGHPHEGLMSLGAATSWSRMLTIVLVSDDPAVGGAIAVDSAGSGNGLAKVNDNTRLTSFGGGGKGRKNSSGRNRGKMSLLI